MAIRGSDAESFINVEKMEQKLVQHGIKPADGNAHRQEIAK
jgi:hypothetical protein